MHHSSAIAEMVGGIIALLLIAALVLALTKRIHLPFTVVLVVVGIALAELAGHWPHTLGLVGELRISPDLILYVFLPTLIFESAFNLDARALRHNLGAVLLLAIPGLLLSTLLIGLGVAFATPIPIAAALLLGAILSATDPVAVVALFKQLGAPQRLMTLVEGESLFNDATSIVVAGILVGVVTAGSVSAETIGHGVIEFAVLFLGGLLVGWLLGLLTGYVLGMVESDPFIEITLTTIVAYLSFLIAEELFHVSGVMATVAAGIMLGGWGRMRVSTSVRAYLEHFWEYLAFIANALIFLLVGLTIDLAALWNSIDIMLWVILAMLVSRAVVVYGLTPLLNRLPGAQVIGMPYQTVMFWGGLRGAIALAIVLSLPAFEQSEIFVPVVMGAVLFSLLVQGLSIETLMKRFGLDQSPLADRLNRLESLILGKQRARERIPDLQQGGLFSGPIAGRLSQQCDEQLITLNRQLQNLRQDELDQREEENLLYLRCFSEEKAFYVALFNKGHISERALRELLLTLNLQIESIRYQGGFHGVHLHGLGWMKIEQRLLFRWMDRLPLVRNLSEGLRRRRVSLNYEEAWGHHQANGHVLKRLGQIAQDEPISQSAITKVYDSYEHWHALARQQLDQMSEQYPEFVSAMQERLARRMLLLAERETIEEQKASGLLPAGEAEQMEHEMNMALRALRGQEPARLAVEPQELLRKVPFFQNIPEGEFIAIAERMHAHTIAENEIIIKQGEGGQSLFLIARGVVRVSVENEAGERDLATLMAGDFVGEMALLHGEKRSATVRAVTPCSLYELSRDALDAVMAQYPVVREALERADQLRQQALND